MKSISLFLLAFVCFLNSNAQNHEGFLMQAFIADSAFGAGDHKLCAELYEKAYSYDSVYTNGHVYMYGASCMALAGMEDKAFQYIYKAIDKGWVFLEDTKMDPDLESLHNAKDGQWNKMIQYFENKVNEYEAALTNKDLRKSLLSMLEQDQYFRRKAFETDQKYGPDSKELKLVVDSLIETDSLNLVALSQILSKEHFPTYSEVGVDGVEAMFVLLSHQHHNLAIREKALPLALLALNERGVGSTEVAELEDHILQDQGKKQRYGTKIYRNDKGEVKLWPVENLQVLDAIRLSADMRPIKLFLQEFEIPAPSASDEIPKEFQRLN